MQEWLESVVLNDKDGLVGVLKVAIDESGTHGGSPLVCVAACLATSRQWRLLLDEWMEFISPLVPPGKAYHAKDTRYDEASEFLASLLVRRMDLICALTVDKADYKAVAPDRFRSVYGGNPYALAVQGLLLYVARWCQERGSQKVAYVLESGAQGQGFLENMFKVAMKPHLRGRFRLHSYTWVGKENPIVHAPDLVSHEVWTCLDAPNTRVYDILHPKLELHHLNKRGIAQTVEEVWEGERENKRMKQAKRLRRR